jgi:hypothetical protein
MPISALVNLSTSDAQATPAGMTNAPDRRFCWSGAFVALLEPVCRHDLPPTNHRASNENGAVARRINSRMCSNAPRPDRR